MSVSATHPFAPVLVGHTTFPLKAQGPRPDLALSLPDVSGDHFRLLDGPPYANGPLHLGHVLNKHLKDLAARAHAAAGAQVQWTPRWDCHGLPVELNVERSGADRADPTSFVPAARAYALGQMHAQRTTFQSLGLCANWEHPACTMDPPQQAATLRVLADLVEARRLEVRHRPTPWCPACRSTVAGAEQETKTVTRTEAVVPFFLADQSVLLSWTTTPWSLPTHAGLVLNPTAHYQAFDWNGQRAWAAMQAWDQVARWYPGATQVGTPCLGTELAGRAYTTPWGTTHQVVCDEGVLPSAGTGCLHAVPAFDSFDAEVGQRHGWPTVHVLDEAGRFNDQAWAPLKGLSAGEPSSQVVLDHLRQQPSVSHWLKTWSEQVTVPACWRHKAPLLTRPSRQVFLVLDETVRARAMAMVEAVAFEPAAAQARLRHQMVGRPDWCLSRQRTWGVPLALVLDPSTGQPHQQASAVMRAVAAAVESEGVEAWWTSPVSRWTEGLAVDPTSVVRVDDVLDVWFDSGALSVHQGAPADLVVEGHDQLRGWFQACVWVAAALGRPAPFKRVVTHGFVVDENGRKLSKSAGGDRATRGVPGWATLPSDVVRLWAAMGEVGADRPWSQATVTAAQQAYGRFRNTLRFALANVPATQWGAATTSWEGWAVLDRDAVAQGFAMREQVLPDLCAGRYEPAVRAALQYADQVLSSGLFVRLKDRLYCAPDQGVARRAAVAALKDSTSVLLDVLRVLTPQLVAEALSHTPALSEAVTSVPPALSSAEETWVKHAHLARQAVAEVWAAQGWKGGQDLACLSVAVPVGTEPWENAEALVVGQWSAHVSPSPEAVSVQTPWGLGQLRLSPDPQCPRCRRPGVLTQEGTCDPCSGINRSVLTWR